MFDLYCKGHGGPTIVSGRSIVALDQHDGTITLHLRCWCGHLIVHRTGHHRDTVDRPDPLISAVAAVPPATPSRALAHFTGRLSFETDPADVWRDLEDGSARFVLVDARTRAAYDEAHLPGAVNLPHAELTSEAARRLLDEHRPEFVVTYCWGPACNAATKAAAKLAAYGVSVKELLGGIEAWRAEGLPVVGGTEGSQRPCSLASSG